MRVWRRMSAACAGVLLALAPMAVAAAEEGRALDPTQDWGKVMLVTFGGIAGVMLVAALGYLYRQRRHLIWGFQQPDESHDNSH